MVQAPESKSSLRRGGKSAAAFRTISEVALELDLPQHVLRFWETKFPLIRPLKRGGGRRYYRPEDLVLLRRIRDLLYNDGYTIKGVQKLLRQNGAKVVALENKDPPTETPAPGPELDRRKRDALKSVVDELEELRDLLRASSD